MEQPRDRRGVDGGRNSGEPGATAGMLEPLGRWRRPDRDTSPPSSAACRSARGHAGRVSANAASGHEVRNPYATIADYASINAPRSRRVHAAPTRLIGRPLKWRGASGPHVSSRRRGDDQRNRPVVVHGACVVVSPAAHREAAEQPSSSPAACRASPLFLPNGGRTHCLPGAAFCCQGSALALHMPAPSRLHL